VSSSGQQQQQQQPKNSLCKINYFFSPIISFPSFIMPQHRKVTVIGSGPAGK
jgi:hypothetical protein